MKDKICGIILIQKLWNWILETMELGEISPDLKSRWADFMLDYPKKKPKNLEYQKSLLTLDVGWASKLSCKISAF